jgi:hypothetical protein
MLVEMGFDPERAELATKKTGSLQDAIDWLDKNADKPLDEIKGGGGDATAEGEEEEPPALQAGEQARSLVCDDCGKKFRSQAQAEWHAEKTDHANFSESTEELKPLTEEEKKAKLEELQAMAALKRAAQVEEDRLQQKKNEEIRRKATKESQDIREQLQMKEKIKEAEKKKREKQEDILQRKKVLEQIQRDKEERRRKAEAEKAAREGRAVQQQPVTTAPAATQPVKKAVDYTEARLRLQTGSGTVTKSFPVDTTLFEVAQALQAENGTMAESFTQNFPKKVFGVTEFGMTLKEAGMVPSAALIVK